MSYLRTNYRLTGKELDADAIGGGIQNWIEGSAVRPQYFGGLIVGSYAAALPTNVLIISAYGAMQDFFGATIVSNIWGSGFKIMPIVAFNASGEGCSAPEFWHPSAPSGSLAFLVPFRFTVANVSGTGAEGTGYYVKDAAVTVSGQAVHVIWLGFIVSTP